MTTCLLSLMLFATALPADGQLTRSGIPDKDLAKLTKPVVEYFDALAVDDRTKQKESLDDLEEGLAKSAKRVKTDGRLSQFLGDFDLLLELAKPEPREFKSSAGKGFFKHAFEEPFDDVSMGVMLSLPSSYSKSEEIYPAIVALKPVLGLDGSRLEEAVAAMASAMYSDLLETHIILIPLGSDQGSGRKKDSSEVATGWMTDDGLYAFYTGLRVLLEQVRFDRSRLVLEGWGEAGADALRIATTSSFFAGLVLRSSPVDAADLLGENLSGMRVLHIEGGADEGSRDLARLAEVKSAGIDVQELAEEGSALEPGAETKAAYLAWLAESIKPLVPTEVKYMLGDIRFQARNWCKAAVINRRITAKPSDPDFPRFVARADRSRNRIEIEAVNVLEMEVFLSDGLVDMDKPVTIVVNGETKSTRTPRPTLRMLLDNRFYNNSQDYGLYTDQVLIEDIAANVPDRG